MGTMNRQVRNMVSVSVGIALAVAAALIALTVAGTAIAGSNAVEASASRHVRPNLDRGIASDVHDALEDREPGEGIGDIVSEIAHGQRPRPRH